MVSRLKAWARALVREVVTVFLAIRDPRAPWYAKACGALVVAYAFSPIDLVPDFIPVLGLLDDALLLPLGVWLTLRLLPADVVADARARAEAQLREPKPVSRVGAVLVLAVWAAVVYVAVRTASG